MANPFYQNQGSILQAVQQFRQNPLQLLMQRRFNVPQNLMADPDAMVQHLLSTGQISQQRLNSAYQQAYQMGFKR